MPSSSAESAMFISTKPRRVGHYTDALRKTAAESAAESAAGSASETAAGSAIIPHIGKRPANHAIVLRAVWIVAFAMLLTAPVWSGATATLRAQYLPAFSNFGGGSGQQNDPFIISTPAHFNNLRNLPTVPAGNNTLRRYFKLANDIDLSSFASGDGWDPFQAITNLHLDGDGHTIRGLVINRTNRAYTGIFSVLSHTDILNLRIANGQLTVGYASGTPAMSSGLLAGVMNFTTLNGITVSGTVTMPDGFVSTRAGGLVGDFSNSTADGVSAEVSVRGSEDVGGVFGYVQGSTIWRTVADVAVTATVRQAGGIAGNANSSTFNDTGVKARLTAPNRMGGLAGTAFGMFVNRAGVEVSMSPTVALTEDNGGILGFSPNTNTNTQIRDVYTRVTITGNDRWSAGIVGSGAGVSIFTSWTEMHKDGSLGSMFGCITARNATQPTQTYYNSDLCTVSANPGELGRTSAQLAQQATYTGFNFTTPWVFASGINGSRPYVSTVPLLARIELSTTPGWRMLAVPRATSFANLFASAWTQGMVGSGAPAFTQPNIFRYDTQNGNTWEPVGDLAETTQPGRGFVYYHFADRDNDGVRDVAATPISVFAPLTPPTVRVNTVYADDGGAAQWMLLGNPYGNAISFAELTRQSVDNVIYVYTNVGPDTEDDAGNPQYVAWNTTELFGALNDGVIAPFQGFFVRATRSDAYVEFTADAVVSGSGAGLRQRGAAESLDDTAGNQASEIGGTPQATQTTRVTTTGPTRALSLLLRGERRSNRTFFTFGADGSLGGDAKDAWMLEPLAHDWMALFSGLNGNAMDIQHLPLDPGATVDIPLGVRHVRGGRAAGGEFTLSLGELRYIPDGWEILVIDAQTGAEVDLRRESYHFVHGVGTESGAGNANAVAGSLTGAGNAAKVRGARELVEQPALAASDQTFARLTLRLRAAETTSLEGAAGGELPVATELGQNWPNPFNPATQIAFTLGSDVAGSGVVPVRLTVYDLTGRRVAVLVDQNMVAGTHTVSFNAGALASGVYMYRLEAAGQAFVQRMTLLK
jgi:hypothetical protein